MMEWHEGWGMMGGGWLLWLLLLLLIGLITWLAIRAGQGQTQPPGLSHTNSETPLEIVQKRYARGEISKEEFEEMRSDLKSY